MSYLIGIKEGNLSKYLTDPNTKCLNVFSNFSQIYPVWSPDESLTHNKQKPGADRVVFIGIKISFYNNCGFPPPTKSEFWYIQLLRGVSRVLNSFHVTYLRRYLDFYQGARTIVLQGKVKYNRGIKRQIFGRKKHN